MIDDKPTHALCDLAPTKRLFRVISQMRLNETSSPMKTGQQGFAYLPLTEVVEIEVDNFPYTAPLGVFVSATKWMSDLQ